MSRNVQAAILVLLLAALAPIAALAGGNANFTIGQRDLGSDWDPLDGQLMFGAVVDWGADDWPVHLAWGLNVSADTQDNVYGSSVEFTAAYAELSFGVLWLPIKDKPIRPYLGAGIAGVSAAYEAEAFGVSIDDDDQDFGYYLNGGVYWRLGPRFNLGVDLRYGGGTEFDFTFPFEDEFEETFRADGGYFAYSLLLGFGWGK